MRMAVKYSMDDIQVAITKIIHSVSGGQGITKAITRLAFVAEFPGYFSGPFAIQVFIDACPIIYHPTADDLKPLVAYPAFVSLMMQYREGRTNPDGAIWKNIRLQYDYKWKWLGPNSTSRSEKCWLVEQFKSLRFKP